MCSFNAIAENDLVLIHIILIFKLYRNIERCTETDGPSVYTADFNIIY